ncbi:hypothetical protein [Pedobacter hiemivivus]|uniref:MipA/OmpV family protein n=1 Tax=Pedobacter hiemivivus TaxID=2530454 RepID=A0A4R0NBW8_9SPHI|nr:hypothetical protein [Pedobacter hiemivivus]TCC97809.1 hypothetical protein EZ444_07820 [Pedobacter hiemivivus]
MRFIFLLVLISMASFKVQAQEDSVEKTTVTLASLYSSNVSYYGQATNEKLPYILINATVRFPVGLYLSAGSYKLLNYGRGLSETDLGAGFDYDFNEKFSTGIAYTRSFFPSNSPLLQAANENNVNFTANYSWSWLKSSFSTDYAFGKQNDIFLSLTHSKEINIGSLFNEKNALSLAPAIELVAGTRHFYETYTTKKNNRDNANGKGKSPVSPGNSSSTITTTVPADSFNLLSYNFKLPLSLSRANYLAEISYQLSILGPKAEAELKSQQSFFGLAFYYQF